VKKSFSILLKYLSSLFMQLLKCKFPRVIKQIIAVMVASEKKDGNRLDVCRIKRDAHMEVD
jgi:hypothetical protein